MNPHVITILPAQNTSVPGILCLTDAVVGTSGIRNFGLLHAEWIYGLGAEVIPRLSEALRHLAPEELEDLRDGKGKRIIDWRKHGESDIRIIVAVNYWASAEHKLDEHGIDIDSIVTINTGIRPYVGGLRSTVGRMFLLDQLRDATPKIQMCLPETTLEEHPHIVPAHDLRAALREVSHNPRLLEDETGALLLDRNESLLLAIAMGVTDLQRYHGGSWSSPIGNPGEKDDDVRRR